jgi:hypothetical protein
MIIQIIVGILKKASFWGAFFMNIFFELLFKLMRNKASRMNFFLTFEMILWPDSELA